ncbi:3-methyladenine DNA glycosylase [Didymella sp. IMI 355093]|nr:3-methyladenine DNA glycosylase [Didymella sp. IMI 355093]
MTSLSMSLRRSARNAKPAVTGVSEALYQKAETNGSPKKIPSAPHRDIDHPAPSTDMQKKLDARREVTATPKEKPTKKNVAPKRAAAPKKRKAPEPEPQPEPESSIGIDLNVSNPFEVATSIGAPTESISRASSDLPGSAIDSLPTTPMSKERQPRKKADTTSPAKPAPFTPTPSGVGLIAGNANIRKAKDTDHMLDDLASLNRNRPAAPDVTNAPVLTPSGSQVVVNDSPSKKRKANEPLPDVGSPMKSTSTIDTLLKDAEAYLIKVDGEVTGNGRLERLIAGHQCKMFNPEGLREVVDPFTALASGIIGQQPKSEKKQDKTDNTQVSGAAAASIRKKFTSLFEDTHPAFPSPAQVLTKDLPTLRTAGLSQRKAEYITGLAEKFASGEFTAEGLVGASDEDLIEKLVAVRGLGRWSVEMFACFGLKRMDVFSTGDLGVQ